MAADAERTTEEVKTRTVENGEGAAQRAEIANRQETANDDAKWPWRRRHSVETNEAPSASNTRLTTENIK